MARRPGRRDSADVAAEHAGLSAARDAAADHSGHDPSAAAADSAASGAAAEPAADHCVGPDPRHAASAAAGVGETLRYFTALEETLYAAAGSVHCVRLASPRNLDANDAALALARACALANVLRAAFAHYCRADVAPVARSADADSDAWN